MAADAAAVAPTYATIMVHLEIRQSNAALLAIAGELAGRFGAGVIGIAGCKPMPIVYGDGYVPADLFNQDRRVIANDIEAAHAEFLGALGPRVATLEWRSRAVATSLAHYIADEGRSADLIVTSAVSDDLFDAAWRLQAGDLVMRAGRPVLVVPARVTTPKLERVLVAWKDTRETRRAVADALPILKKAVHVIVVEVAPDAETARALGRVADVAAWLGRHGVVAETRVLESASDDAQRLIAFGEAEHCDLMIAGAYGHSRLREWVLGSVTRDLLLGATCCTLLSH